MLKLLLSGTLIGMAASGCAYHPAEYTGDGTMYAVQKGTPRYDLELEPISLTRAGRVDFQLTDLPSENLLALVSINDPTPEKTASVSSPSCGSPTRCSSGAPR